MSKHKDSSLDDLFWRDEILQVLFWLKNERLSEAATVRELCALLNSDEWTIARHLGKLVDAGFLLNETETGTFTLTAAGKEDGSRLFASAFEGMQTQGHGECNLDCSCLLHGPETCPAHPH